MFTVCGEEALNPVAVSTLCRENPQEEVYCLPWVRTQDELARNLEVNKGRPNRMFPCEPNIEEMNAEHVDFKEGFKWDSFGRMSFLLKRGIPVVNQVMTSPCQTDFYGNIIEMRPGAERYIVSVDDVNRYFPHEPLSAKLYAATTVFVRMEGTDELADLTGKKEVNVMLATPFVPGSQEFMGFLKATTGVGIAASFRPDEIFPRKNIAVFRYNKGYTVLFSKYEEMIREGKNAD